MNAPTKTALLAFARYGARSNTTLIVGLRHRANADRIIVLNCGVGRDSLTMWSLLLDDKLEVEGLGTLGVLDIDGVVFSDTGCEWPHTYAALDQLHEQCELSGTPLFVLRKPDGDCARALRPESVCAVVAKAELGGYHTRPSILADLQSRATVASLGKGDCTDNHKIQPIRRLLSDLARVRFGVADNAAWGRLVRKGERGPHVTLIGIAADETSRLRNGGKGPSYVTERYPLVTMGIAKGDEQPHLEEWGFGHLRKSGCYMCPYQPPSWYWALRETEPETYAEVLEFERVALARNPRMNATGVRVGGRQGSLLTIDQVVSRWRERNPDATVDAVLDKQYSRCTKDARAMRKAESASDGKRRLRMAPTPPPGRTN